MRTRNTIRDEECIDSSLPKLRSRHNGGRAYNSAVCLRKPDRSCTRRQICAKARFARCPFALFVYDMGTPYLCSRARRPHMPHDDALAKRVRAALGRARRIEEKKMFGGITFMVRGRMCVSVGRERIMCRIDPAIHDVALERKGCRTVVMKGRQYRGYVHVEAEAVKTKADLDYWIRLALDYNGKVKPGGRKSR